MDRTLTELEKRLTEAKAKPQAPSQISPVAQLTVFNVAEVEKAIFVERFSSASDNLSR